MIALFIVLLGTNPQDDFVRRDSFDLIIVDHFHDAEGKLVFDQVLFLDFNKHLGRHQVEAWRLYKRPNQYPRRDYQRGGFVTQFEDNGSTIEVRALTFREQWSQCSDPELEDRSIWSKEKRRDLIKAPPKSMRQVSNHSEGVR